MKNQCTKNSGGCGNTPHPMVAINANLDGELGCALVIMLDIPKLDVHIRLLKVLCAVPRLANSVSLGKLIDDV